MSKATFNWADPLLLDDQLSADERAVRDAAQALLERWPQHVSPLLERWLRHGQQYGQV